SSIVVRPHGPRASTKAARAAAAGSTPLECVLFGLFNYLAF
ncbi:MAG: hypothetical protein ACJAS1_004068, partial [Oleiphilaceae bacterium]